MTVPSPTATEEVQPKAPPWNGGLSAFSGIIAIMTSGGARTHSGPAPDFTSLRRDRDARTWTRLPAECSRPTPDWPMEVPDPTVAELTLWERLWKLPQAHVWWADRTADQVAMYTRTYIEAARAEASVQRRTLARQLADSLLLSTGALHGAKYVVTDTPEDQMLQQAQAATGTAGGPSPRPGRAGRSARARMGVTVIEGGGADDPDDDDREGDIE